MKVILQQIQELSVLKRFLFHGPFYRPQRSCGQGNVFTGVCLSTGGVSTSVHAWMPSPPIRQTPPQDQADPRRTRQTPLPRNQADPPQTRQTPPGSRLQHTIYVRPVRILLESILVSFIFLQAQLNPKDAFTRNACVCIFQ